MLPRRAMFTLAALLVLPAHGAIAGPVTETAVRYEASSKTAMSITGAVTLSSSALTFGNGAEVGLSAVEDGVAGAWDGLDGDVEGQIFAMEADPGELLNGNTLCGPGKARFVVVSEREAYGMKSLTLTVFEGEDAPTSIDGPGMCGTFGFDADTASPKP